MGDHSCQRAEVEPGVFLVWTDCGRAVRPNAANTAEPGETVSCSDKRPQRSLRHLVRQARLDGKIPLYMEGYHMEHREQHTNREAKKPKKDKPKDGSQGSRSKWVVNEAVEAKTNEKH